MVIVGIDAHKRSHTAVAVDASGRRLGQRTIGTSSEDHLALLGWAEQFGPQRSWAIEDCRHLSRRLEADLLARVTPALLGDEPDRVSGEVGDVGEGLVLAATATSASATVVIVAAGHRADA